MFAKIKIHMKIQFSLKYLLFTVFLFLIEVLIATSLKNIFFVRAYLGDVIVVFLLYTFVKTFIKTNDLKLISGIFIFSCLVEFAQYFNVSDHLGFKPGSIMYIVIGNSFSWIDILCYLAGCLLVAIFLQVKK
jgi:DNA integrity scanning protein DisA with diadenylate cyclase activity